MSETWFKTQKYYGKDALIQPVEVERATGQCVFINNVRRGKVERCAKRSEYEQFFATWEEAHAHLLDRAQARLDGARAALASAEEFHATVARLQP